MNDDDIMYAIEEGLQALNRTGGGGSSPGLAGMADGNQAFNRFFIYCDNMGLDPYSMSWDELCDWTYRFWIWNFEDVQY